MRIELENEELSNWEVPPKPYKPEGATIYELIVPEHLRRPTTPPLVQWNSNPNELWASDPAFDQHEPNAPQPQVESESPSYFD